MFHDYLHVIFILIKEKNMLHIKVVAMYEMWQNKNRCVTRIWTFFHPAGFVFLCVHTGRG